MFGLQWPRPPLMTMMLVMALAAAIIPASRAYPDYWVDGNANQPCDAHPTQDVGNSPHGTPMPDSSIAIRALRDDGVDAIELCPGASYMLQVNYPQRRRSIITASSGSFAETKYLWSTRCPNLLVVGSAFPVTVILPTTVQARLQVPCPGAGSGAAEDKLAVAVTSASSLNLRWRSATRTFPISQSCTSQTCDSVPLQSNGEGARLQMRSGVGAQPPSFITLTNQVTAHEGPKATLATMHVSDAVPKASSSSMTPNSTTSPNVAATAATENIAPSDNGTALTNSMALVPGTEPVNTTTPSDGTIAADSTSAIITTATAPMSGAAPGNTTAAINEAAAAATANDFATNNNRIPNVNDMVPLMSAVSIDGTSSPASPGGVRPAMPATLASDLSQHALTTNAQLQVLTPMADGSPTSAASATVPTITTITKTNTNDTVTVPTPPIAMPIVTLSLKTPVVMQEAPAPSDSAPAGLAVASSQQPLATNGIANVSTRPAVASLVTTTEAVGVFVTAPSSATSLGVFRATDPGQQRRVRGGARRS